MEKFNDIDDFLAKWASGDLTESDKEAFRKTEEYKPYSAILEGTDRLEVPSYDKEKNFQEVQKKMTEEGKVVRLVPKWVYGVAASVAILIGYFFFFDQTVNYETGYGENLVITLPDDSEVILNAKSKLEYEKNNWNAERNLVLEGEAFFKVNKGSTFTVDSENGKITVLGTQFTANSEGDILEVVCYEGKVRVEKNGLEKVLSKGQGLRAIGDSFEDYNQEHQEPSWLQDETTFHNAPLKQVIKALEKQYGVTINLNNVDENQRFTGSFTHEDLGIALLSVFESLEISFTYKDEKTIDLVQE